jgi:hypothetical protein
VVGGDESLWHAANSTQVGPTGVCLAAPMLRSLWCLAAHSFRSVPARHRPGCQPLRSDGSARSLPRAPVLTLCTSLHSAFSALLVLSGVRSAARAPRCTDLRLAIPALGCPLLCSAASALTAPQRSPALALSHSHARALSIPSRIQIHPCVGTHCTYFLIHSLFHSYPHSHSLID